MPKTASVLDVGLVAEDGLAAGLAGAAAKVVGEAALADEVVRVEAMRVGRHGKDGLVLTEGGLTAQACEAGSLGGRAQR